MYNWETPNYVFDVTDSIETKIASIFAHKTQIDDPPAVAKRIKERHAKLGCGNKMKYGEGFTKLVFN